MPNQTINSSLSLIEGLSEIAGASGHEANVSAFIQSKLTGYDCRGDSFGNLYCEPTAPTSARVLLSAHMDEVGLMVQAISYDGFLRLAPLGGWQAEIICNQRWRVITQSGEEILGVTAYLPPHHNRGNKTSPQLEAICIDIGAANAGEVAESGVRVGDSIVPDSAFTALANDKLFVGKAFDNRLGVALALELMNDDALAASKPYAFFSAQEEMGARGAQAYSGSTEFAMGIILEAAPADDHPSVPPDQRQCRLQAGPQIRLYDPGFTANKALIDRTIEIAKQLGVPHQLAVRRSGGTDAGALQYKLKAPLVVIAVPTRYIHAHNAIFHLDDYQATKQLVRGLIAR